MLYQARDVAAVLARLAGDPVRGFTLRNYCRQRESGADVSFAWQPVVLVDDRDDPRVLAAHMGANFLIYGEIQRYLAAMGDLLEGRVEQEGGWPDEQMNKDWAEDGGRRALFLNTCPYPVWRSAVEAGFEPHPEDRRGQVAYMWHISGPPRFAHLVQHPCRLGEGLELLELLKQGVHYDPEGQYIKVCLEHGPSFVCEAPDDAGAVRPVCWSCTHLNRTMGMIYTPPELRRHGYARSLAAFQFDHMLAEDGIACCHVVDRNVPSMSMVAGFGMQRWEEAVVWRAIYWPGEAPPLEAT